MNCKESFLQPSLIKPTLNVFSFIKVVFVESFVVKIYFIGQGFKIIKWIVYFISGISIFIISLISMIHVTMGTPFAFFYTAMPRIQNVSIP